MSNRTGATYNSLIEIFTREDVVSSIEVGGSLRGIAKHLCVSRHTASNLCKRFGLKSTGLKRPRGHSLQHHMDNITDECVRETYRREGSIRVSASVLGVQKSAMVKLLDRAGVVRKKGNHGACRGKTYSERRG